MGVRYGDAEKKIYNGGLLRLRSEEEGGMGGEGKRRVCLYKEVEAMGGGGI